MATPPTGRPRGRPRGAQNRKTAEQKAAVARVAVAIEALVPEAFTGDAHAFLMTVYKDPTIELDKRLDAAGKAIRFEKPTLSSVEARIEHSVQDLDEAQLNAEILREGTAAGLIAGGGSTH